MQTMKLRKTSPNNIQSYKIFPHSTLPVLSLFTLLVSFFLSSCTTKIETPEEVAKQFWDSAQSGKLDAAKEMVTWDTVGYLKYFRDDKFTIKRVDLGEVNAQDQLVKIDTTLILDRKNKEKNTQGEDKNDVRIPTQTILVKTENVWRVQLKQTLAQVINKTVNEAANQFNQMFQQGMLELNNALSGSINDISKSLDEGVKEFGKMLEENANGYKNSSESPSK